MAVVKRKLPPDAKGGKKKSAAIERPVAMLDLSLPEFRSSPLARLQDYTILLFGEKKIGKTDLSAQFPDTIHLMTEPGAKAQEIFQVPIRNWKELKGYIRLLEKDKRFKTIVLDTVDLAYKLCFDFAIQRLGVAHPSDEAYGKGWAAIRDEFLGEMQRLMSMGKGVIFISHATEKEIKTRNGEKYDKIMPTLAGQGRDVVEGMVDLWFYYGYDGRDRVLTITGSDHIGAGHRLKKNFRYPNGEPIREISMGHNAEEAYRNLLLAFDNRYTQGQPSAEPSAKKPIVKKTLKLKR